MSEKSIGVVVAAVLLIVGLLVATGTWPFEQDHKLTPQQQAAKAHQQALKNASDTHADYIEVTQKYCTAPSLPARRQLIVVRRSFRVYVQRYNSIVSDGAYYSPRVERLDNDMIAMCDAAKRVIMPLAARDRRTG